jgi:hypothetical protein
MMPPSSVIGTSPTAMDDTRRALSFKSATGPAPTRRELAKMMGIDYEDRSRKTYVRSKVKEYVLQYIDMSKPFKQYSYPDVMYPIIKGCAKYMNRQVLTKHPEPWSRTTTHNVIHSLFEDTRRNLGSKEKSAAKRKERRESAVSLKSSRVAVLLTNINFAVYIRWQHK